MDANLQPLFSRPLTRSHSLTLAKIQFHWTMREKSQGVQHSLLPSAAFDLDVYSSTHQHQKGTRYRESTHNQDISPSQSVPHCVPQRNLRLEVRFIGHIVQPMAITRREQSILYARNRLACIGEVTIDDQPSGHQAAAELSTDASHQSRTNPSDPATRYPFQTAGQVSYPRVQDIPYHLRVSSRKSPTGRPHGGQMLSRLRRADAFQKGEAYTSRLVRYVRRTGQGMA